MRVFFLAVKMQWKIIQAYAKPFRVAYATTMSPSAVDMALRRLPRAYANGCFALCFRDYSVRL